MHSMSTGARQHEYSHTLPLTNEYLHNTLQEYADAEALFASLSALLRKENSGGRGRAVRAAAIEVLAGPFAKAFPDYADKVGTGE